MIDGGEEPVMVMESWSGICEQIDLLSETLEAAVQAFDPDGGGEKVRSE